MVKVGQVLGAFGVAGAVKVLPLTDFADRFARGGTLHLDGQMHQVVWSRRHTAGLVLKLTGIDNRDRAASLRGRYLEVPDGELRALPVDTFYHHDLVGLEVRTEAGASLGSLVAVLERPANDVWVARDGDVEHLVPATKQAVVGVDLAAGRVTVANWLLDVEDA